MIDSSKAFEDFVRSSNASRGGISFGGVGSTSIASTTATGSPSDAERDGLLGIAQKHIGAFSSSATSAFGAARSSITGAHQRIQENAVSWESLMYFAIASGTGVLFMTIAFLFLPMLLVMPHKFALFFTMGSLSFIVGLVMLRGIKPFIKAVLQSSRLPFTLTYCASVLLTLYASLFLKSYVLALGTAVTQAVCLFVLVVSYVPGGRRFLEMCGKHGCSSFLRWMGLSGNGGGGGPTLPL